MCLFPVGVFGKLCAKHVEQRAKLNTFILGNRTFKSGDFAGLSAFGSYDAEDFQGIQCTVTKWNSVSTKAVLDGIVDYESWNLIVVTINRGSCFAQSFFCHKGKIE